MLLEEIKVVEYATYVAAPSCAALLAEWGAEVIKVEPLSGDPHRHFLRGVPLEDGIDPAFELDNRGKRGISVDTASEQGAAILQTLAKRADVFVTNVRAASLERRRLDAASLMVDNPSLIYAHFTGYGSSGPDRDLPGFDVTAFWARTGLNRLSVYRDADPIPPRHAVGDHAAGLALTNGVLAALVERARTGRGRLVEGSLVRAGLYVAGVDFALQLKLGRVASTRRRHEQIEPTANYFASSDRKWFVVSPKGPEGWRAICRAANEHELLEDPRLSKARGRREHCAEIVAALDVAFGAMPFEVCAARLNQEDAAWAPVQTLAEAAEDPQIRAAGAVVEARDRNGRTFEAPAPPVTFGGLPEGLAAGGAPAIGEHTAEILTELGFEAVEVQALVDAGVVRLGQGST